MNRRNFSNSISVAAFTLVEVMIAAGVSTAMFGAILVASTALQKSFKATDDYSTARANQQQAIDYISRDLRSAYTVTVSADTLTLTVTMPEYYSTRDAQGNPTGAPVNPVITDGQADYGNTAQPVTVSYFVSGSSMIRQQWWWTAGVQQTAQVIVASDVQDFESSFADLTSVVTFGITFAQKYTARYGTTSAQRQGTRISTSTSVRNSRRD